VKLIINHQNYYPLKNYSFSSLTRPNLESNLRCLALQQGSKGPVLVLVLVLVPLELAIQVRTLSSGSQLGRAGKVLSPFLFRNILHLQILLFWLRVVVVVDGSEEKVKFHNQLEGDLFVLLFS
jgi:hypothetical protein